MNNKPILFNTDMVKAILSGRKTQTRRIVKPQTLIGDDGLLNVEAMTDSMWRKANKELPEHFGAKYFCPHGQPGDLLWVREMWSGEYWLKDILPKERFLTPNHTGLAVFPPATWYWADGNPNDGDWEPPRPSIHMPRWASRLTLKITDIRIERVQDISEEDCDAEMFGGDFPHRIFPDFPFHGGMSLQECFAMVWDSIYAEQGYSWDSNPWVWVIEFDVIQKNIDEVLKASS